ncbi:L-threonylcarbamoyladenylate synthase [uncultured Sunxiuqinia sp.]|jgi:tRNA threonylcarbamoyl adenosine modification protein (Sua5/YciO/YrdC/YwlC family)|uniref:L-threonylcarbamoyladenylate synthase n=1 Tax=uncultured Sunxiuqinia sp. TaxID=1573825 RepID=UPI0019B30D08|nr:threonylcarbamoyl-AMP synthase [Sunxiuqinia sp.]|tara:strand:+ start:2955 stop:3569 length:615 start_codon:yes stop_codon:yes gene_type:complete
MLIKLYEENPNQRDIEKVLEVLRDGGIIIYPTDTVYGIGCDITNVKAVEKIAQYKKVQVEKSNMSFICSDLSHLSDYTKPISNTVFKLLKRNLPGPFTFILEANSNVPKYFKGKKKTVGIRVPDNNIIREIVRQLGNPILSTSVYDEDTVIEYTTDPELIHEKFADFADLVIDGGYGDNMASTVIDCTVDLPVIIRQGKGVVQE